MSGYNDLYKRNKMSRDTSDYTKGYQDGMNAAFEGSALDAYYAGVGYGKKVAKDRNVGFNSDEEREQFERGIKNKDKHFKGYRAEKPSFLERLFGVKTSRAEAIDVRGAERRRKAEQRVKKNWFGGRKSKRAKMQKEMRIRDKLAFNEYKAEKRKADKNEKKAFDRLAKDAKRARKKAQRKKG